MTIQDSQKWSEQITGKGGVIPSLNQRLYLIKRLKNQINTNKIKKVANSIWTSKLRYGLQLYAKTRTTEEHPINKNMGKLQVAQNKLMRTLANVNITDRPRTKDLLIQNNMLSVNQTSAQIKLTEIWKARNTENNPLKIQPRITSVETRKTRSVSKGTLANKGSATITTNTFIEDAIRVWNNAPEAIKSAKTLYSVKTEIKRYCNTLPI